MFLRDPNMMGMRAERLYAPKDLSCLNNLYPKKLGWHFSGWHGVLGNALIRDTNEMVKIQTGKLLYLEATELSPKSAFEAYVCRNIISFVPESGHVYDVQQTTFSNKGCRLELRDRATGQRPGSYAVYPVENISCLENISCFPVDR
jgi:hypothetical protein